MFAMYSEEAYQARIKQLVLLIGIKVDEIDVSIEYIKEVHLGREALHSMEKKKEDFEEIKAILEKQLISDSRYNKNNVPICPDCGSVMDRPVLGINICRICNKHIKISNQ